MTITLCNSHPFTFYLPFHTSLRADQCPIQSHVPSTCTLGLDPCARHSLFGRTDPYYIDNFYSSCGLKRLAATLASPLLCNCTVLPVPLSTGPYLGGGIKCRHCYLSFYTCDIFCVLPTNVVKTQLYLVSLGGNTSIKQAFLCIAI